MELTLERLGRLALDLLYPPRCVLCAAHGSFICDRCRYALPRAEGLRCEVCWLPLAPGATCRRCAEQPPALNGLRSVFRYEGDVRRLVHSFKFGGHSCLAEPLAAELVTVLDEWDPAIDLVVPVPMTGSRRRRRGFNQAALLAVGVAKPARLPVVEALARRSFAGPQERTRNAEQRRANVRDAFSTRDAAAVEGRSILLVDDIATTGATLDACAQALRRAGAIVVYGLTLARED